MAKKQNYKGMVYVEPIEYFSEETRRKYKLGEFADKDEEDKEDEDLD